MNINLDTLEPMGLPMCIDRSTEILAWLKGKSKDKLKELWKCNDKIVEQNVRRLENMDLYHRLTPAILSAFYGVLKPMDGVTPYRLEMKAKATIGNEKTYMNIGEICFTKVLEMRRAL